MCSKYATPGLPHSSQFSCDAESKVDDVKPGHVLPPVRRAQPSRVGSPRAAFVDPVRAVAIGSRRTVPRRAFIIRGPAIGNPFKHVSCGVIQAESIGFVAPHGAVKTWPPSHGIKCPGLGL
jgi:hypothetical protein